jgi:dihydropteroate synthase
MLKKMPVLVGVLNITPDSFSDGGDFLDPQTALSRAKQMITEGADMIDIGAESTAPHNTEISPEEEWHRLKNILPILLKNNFPISLDSQKYQTWEKFFALGGEMVNDVSGLKKDTPEKIALLQKYPEIKVVIMFSRDITPKEPENFPEKILEEIEQFFAEKIELLKNAGISKERIVLDTGMGGFLSKNPEISFAVLKNLSRFTNLGCPLFIGTSRKSFLANVSQKPNPADRLVSSIVSSMVAVQNGADYIRVHDVAEMKEALGVLEKVS